ncbi:ABC transporter transmembrane domain-containing protein [Novosphingobium terrae]|uniref:ABC transporter transmembrane domain-containing protein n=1 Tax=Novosphingobium terrae TaxID=2726189 RepID=UPI00197D5C3A|nr:ABC transporter transmembrane domain-containing protein [Novosphingobium terrae]
MQRLVLASRPSRAVLFTATLVINLTALTLPMVARQIISRGQQNPNGSTVFVLVALVIAAAATEGVLKLNRNLVIAHTDRLFLTQRLHWLIDRVVRARRLEFKSAAAASLDYSGAIHQLKGIANGEVLLAKAEIAFAPVILLLIYVISWRSGIVVTVFLGCLAAFTWHSAHRYSLIAENSRDAIEHRFDMLFTILERMHLVKAMAVEPQMVRVYEQAHGEAMRNNLALANSASRLTHSNAIAGMLLNIILLFSCALAAERGAMNLAMVISTILLASRLMEPIQRAVFMHIQARDRDSAFVKIRKLDEDTRMDAPAQGSAHFEKLQQYRLDGAILAPVSHTSTGPVPLPAPINLVIEPGECIAISSPSRKEARALLRAMAGLDELAGGAVKVNDLAFEAYGPNDRNHILTYLSSDHRLFDGTIQDNITRFGEVSVEAAYEVARLLGIDKRLDELPGGMQTPVGDSAGGTVAPGLERQIAILRGLTHRPRIILFDHADQGLDRDGYARLINFFSQVRGMATVVIASEDANLASLADRAFRLEDGALSPCDTIVPFSLPYRSLVL